MTFGLSPGVYNREIDLSATVQGTSTSAAGIAGIFSWGPVLEPTLIGSEGQLAQVFGKPSNLNPVTWFSGANFLGYGNALWTVRTANTTANTANAAFNAVANTASIVSILNNVVLNKSTFSSQSFTDTGVLYIAKYPGAMGNSLRVSQCDSPAAYSSNVSFSGTIVSGNGVGNSYTGSLGINIGSNTGQLIFTITAGSNVASGNVFATALMGDFSIGDNILVGNTFLGSQSTNVLKLTGIGNAVTNSTVTAVTLNFQNSLRVPYNVTANTVRRYWEFYNQVSNPPGETHSVKLATGNSSIVDQLSVVVVDQDGLFSGVPGTILETYNNLSYATDAVNSDGSSSYYKNVINQQSQYVWSVNDRTGLVSNSSVNLVNSTNLNALNLNFVLGQDGDSEAQTTLQTLANGWQMLTDKTYPISFMITGLPVGGTGVVGGQTYNNFQLANWVVQNIVPQRKNDCVVFASPDLATVLNNTNHEAIDIVGWSELINPSTYLMIDSGWKYQYDKYNNIYRWIPLNGDIAGTCAYTDQVAFPWFSPAGVTRGLINNVTKLAYNPSETDRDYLYPNAINPVITEAGYGTYLDGDRTFTIQNTSFGRINVRRLFIYLETSIGKSAKTLVFEINDVFLQNQFKNMVIPFLKGVEAQRGMYDFEVICDATNNTPQVLGANEFIGAIYIKPSKVADFIRIDYINVSDAATFAEVENPSF